MIRRTLQLTKITVAKINRVDGGWMLDSDVLTVKGQNLTERQLKTRVKRYYGEELKILGTEEVTETYEVPVNEFVKIATIVEDSEKTEMDEDIESEVYEDDEIDNI